MLGSADLAADLGLELTLAETELAYPRARLAMASAAAGIEAPIDAVHLDVRDPEGMRVSTRRGSALGFSAKACIHPDQVGIANDEHTPNIATVDRAREVVEIARAMAESVSGVGIAPDGAFVDRPVIMRAQQILARARRMEEAERNG
ncbi:aldolase/citrate lyase family protein [Microbacterium suwonense]|uniref:HpcH/HpaI aldolase/citrate lyase domain-containing protein n=2 Tax=Microbacterium suwonense TaxID=683047 RepID=A0ABN6X3M1_9MICO|nr:aldolase/citrate lyase family protein [Microbacterium suwonense]BDZ39307.1 hypothetical protein GCM10025863_19210 [Microbacterium suwonense]